MRPRGSAEVLEDRRRRALKLLRIGFSLQEVGRRVGCAASSVMRWRNLLRRGGPKALKVRPTPGRPPKLNARERKRLVQLLLQGPLAHGYRTDLWTTARIAEVIRKAFGVHYHRDHIGRLMHNLGWSHQKPERRSLERDEGKIERWKRKDWPRVKKNATRLGAHIVFIDESGFLLIPNVRKTWAPRGVTPILRHWARHDKISAISGISVSPQRQRLGLYYHLYRHNIRQEEACRFLRHLLKHLRGHVYAVWDRGLPHRGQPIRDLCSRFPRLHLEWFPTFAPELNPDEGVWSLAKAALANGRPDDLTELRRHLRRSLNRIRDSQKRLRGCIHASDLPPFLL